MEYTVLSCAESRIKNNRNYYSRFQVGPFLKDQAITYANTLRRILLADMSNVVIQAISINDATHEYSFIEGVKESVLDILLNLKQIVFVKNAFLFHVDSYFAYLKVKGPNIVRAKDIILPNALKCVDSNQYIATLSNNATLAIKMKLVNYSFNFSSFSMDFNSDSLLSSYTFSSLSKNSFQIYLDSNFSSVNKVNYFIDSADGLENTLDFISLEIWTNGSLSPRLAIQNSIMTIVDLFVSVYDSSSISSSLIESDSFLDSYVYNLTNKMSFLKTNFFSSFLDMKYHKNFSIDNSKFIGTSIDNLKISLQSKFLLKKSGIFNLYDLVNMNAKDLLINFSISQKSLKDIKKKMLSYNLYLKD